MLEGSQKFALSLLEHNFDSSGWTVEVKSKVLTAGASCLTLAREINQPARTRLRQSTLLIICTKSSGFSRLRQEYFLSLSTNLAHKLLVSRSGKLPVYVRTDKPSTQKFEFYARINKGCGGLR